MEPFFHLTTFGGMSNHQTKSTHNASVEDPPPHWCLYDVDIDHANSVVVSIADYSEGYWILHHAYIETI